MVKQVDNDRDLKQSLAYSDAFPPNILTWANIVINRLNPERYLFFYNLGHSIRCNRLSFISYMYLIWVKHFPDRRKKRYGNNQLITTLADVGYCWWERIKMGLS